MAKASDNLFPYMHLVPAAAPSSPSAGSERLYLDSGDGNKLKRKNSSGTVTTIEGGGSATTELLAVTRYAPASQTTCLTTSSTMVDADATNLAITFTAPASGKVLVRLSCYVDSNGVASDVFWGLREGSSDVSGSICRMVRSTSGDNYLTATIYVTGLSAGSHTFKWSHGVQTATTMSARLIIQDGSGTTKWAPALMEVWSAP